MKRHIANLGWTLVVAGGIILFFEGFWWSVVNAPWILALVVIGLILALIFIFITDMRKLS